MTTTGLVILSLIQPLTANAGAQLCAFAERYLDRSCSGPNFSKSLPAHPHGRPAPFLCRARAGRDWNLRIHPRKASSSSAHFIWKAPRSANGVISVVNRTTDTITATSGALKIPLLAPMAVTINPTSPRDTMPHPIRKLRTVPIPRAYAAMPQPTSLLTIATIEITASSSQWPPSARKLLASPIDTKKSGIRATRAQEHKTFAQCQPWARVADPALFRINWTCQQFSCTRWP